MPVATVFEHCLSLDNRLVVEYFYHREKLDNPVSFFDRNPGLFELVFPSHEETQHMNNKNLLYGAMHKLVISEFGFNLVFR
jgi:hypothetical protein